MEAMFRVDTNNIVSDLDTFTSRFWSEACRSRQALQSILVDPDVDNPLTATELLGDMNVSLDEYLLSKLGKRRPVSYEVSNIGIVVQRPQADGENNDRECWLSVCWMCS